MLMNLYLILVLLLSTSLVSAQIYDDEIIEDEKVEVQQDKTNSKRPKNDRGLSPNKIENLFVGLNFSLGIGNTFYLDVSPYAGYKFGDMLGVGAGLTYIYFADVINSYDDNIYGGRLFVKFRPFKEQRFLNTFNLHAELEYLNHSEYVNGKLERVFVPAVNVGLGYNTNFSKGFAFSFDFLINVLWFQRLNQGLSNVYSIPWMYRTGIYYAF